MKVKFKGWNCIVKKFQYSNGATALRLIDAEDGSPVATCSTNLTEEAIDARLYITSDKLPWNYCYIKTWGENDGIFEALIEAGAIDFDKTIPVGPHGSYASLVRILI